MTVGIIIQTRTGSSRLPSKVMMKADEDFMYGGKMMKKMMKGGKMSMPGFKGFTGASGSAMPKFDKPARRRKEMMYGGKMKKAGHEDRAVMSVTGHRKVETLRNYDPAPDNAVKLEMSKAILAPKKKVARPSSTISSGQIITHAPTVVVAEVHQNENQR